MIKCVLFNYACMYVHRGLVKWYNNGLQNHCWEFDSLIPCHLEICSSYAMLELIYKKLIFSRKKLSFFIIKLKTILLLKNKIMMLVINYKIKLSFKIISAL